MESIELPAHHPQLEYGRINYDGDENTAPSETTLHPPSRIVLWMEQPHQQQLSDSPVSSTLDSLNSGTSSPAEIPLYKGGESIPPLTTAPNAPTSESPVPRLVITTIGAHGPGFKKGFGRPSPDTKEVMSERSMATSFQPEPRQRAVRTALFPAAPAGAPTMRGLFQGRPVDPRHVFQAGGESPETSTWVRSSEEGGTIRGSPLEELPQAGRNTLPESGTRAGPTVLEPAAMVLHPRRMKGGIPHPPPRSTSEQRTAMWVDTAAAACTQRRARDSRLRESPAKRRQQRAMQRAADSGERPSDRSASRTCDVDLLRRQSRQLGDAAKADGGVAGREWESVLQGPVDVSLNLYRKSTVARQTRETLEVHVAPRSRLTHPSLPQAGPLKGSAAPRIALPSAKRAQAGCFARVFSCLACGSQPKLSPPPLPPPAVALLRIPFLSLETAEIENTVVLGGGEQMSPEETTQPDVSPNLRVPASASSVCNDFTRSPSLPFSPPFSPQPSSSVSLRSQYGSSPLVRSLSRGFDTSACSTAGPVLRDIPGGSITSSTAAQRQGPRSVLDPPSFTPRSSLVSGRPLSQGNRRLSTTRSYSVGSSQGSADTLTAAAEGVLSPLQGRRKLGTSAEKLPEAASDLTPLSDTAPTQLSKDGSHSPESIESPPPQPPSSPPLEPSAEDRVQPTCSAQDGAHAHALFTEEDPTPHVTAPPAPVEPSEDPILPSASVGLMEGRPKAARKWGGVSKGALFPVTPLQQGANPWAVPVWPPNLPVPAHVSRGYVTEPEKLRVPCFISRPHSDPVPTARFHAAEAKTLRSVKRGGKAPKPCDLTLNSSIAEEEEAVTIVVVVPVVEVEVVSQTEVEAAVVASDAVVVVEHSTDGAPVGGDFPLEVLAPSSNPFPRGSTAAPRSRLTGKLASMKRLRVKQSRISVTELLESTTSPETSAEPPSQATLSTDNAAVNEPLSAAQLPANLTPAAVAAEAPTGVKQSVAAQASVVESEIVSAGSDPESESRQESVVVPTYSKPQTGGKPSLLKRLQASFGRSRHRSAAATTSAATSTASEALAVMATLTDAPPTVSSRASPARARAMHALQLQSEAAAAAADAAQLRLRRLESLARASPRETPPPSLSSEGRYTGPIGLPGIPPPGHLSPRKVLRQTLDATCSTPARRAPAPYATNLGTLQSPGGHSAGSPFPGRQGIYQRAEKAASPVRHRALTSSIISAAVPTRQPRGTFRTAAQLSQDVPSSPQPAPEPSLIAARQYPAVYLTQRPAALRGTIPRPQVGNHVLSGGSNPPLPKAPPKGRPSLQSLAYSPPRSVPTKSGRPVAAPPVRNGPSSSVASQAEGKNRPLEGRSEAGQPAQVAMPHISEVQPASAATAGKTGRGLPAGGRTAASGFASKPPTPQRESAIRVAPPPPPFSPVEYRRCSQPPVKPKRSIPSTTAGSHQSPVTLRGLGPPAAAAVRTLPLPFTNPKHVQALAPAPELLNSTAKTEASAPASQGATRRAAHACGNYFVEAAMPLPGSEPEVGAMQAGKSTRAPRARVMGGGGTKAGIRLNRVR